MHRTAILCGILIAASAENDAAQSRSAIEPLPEVPAHLAFVPSDVAERMLELAEVNSHDVVYDLGCGDGRVAILAAKKYGARSVGIDTDAKRIAEANANAEKAGVANLVRFAQQDTIDTSEATVLTMTIPQSAAWLNRNTLLNPTVTKPLKPGARIVTNFVSGSMKDWKPDRVDHFKDASGHPRAILYLWKISGTA
jgi:ribosomal protein L11 methylase PrmA